jgi:hypothetical protein
MHTINKLVFFSLLPYQPATLLNILNNEKKLLSTATNNRIQIVPYRRILAVLSNSFDTFYCTVPSNRKETVKRVLLIFSICNEIQLPFTVSFCIQKIFFS